VCAGSSKRSRAPSTGIQIMNSIIYIVGVIVIVVAILSFFGLR
jgi:LPXTG-motif cell wall-anchored protein